MELDKKMEEIDDGTPRQGKNSIWSMNVKGEDLKKVVTTDPGYITDIFFDDSDKINFELKEIYKISADKKIEKMISTRDWISSH